MPNATAKVLLALFSLLMCGLVNAESFVVPFRGSLYLTPLGGESDPLGRSKFGIGTTAQNFVQYFTGLAHHTVPNNEVFVGFFEAGSTVHFGMFSEYIGFADWGFSNGTDPASLKAFSDEDNSLGMGGNIIQQTSPSTWLMNLDFANVGDPAAGIGFDDDDNDILMQIRIDPNVVPIPEAGPLFMLLAAVVIVHTHGRRSPRAT